MKTISDRLNFLRGYLKLSQPEVATRFGIPYNSYIKYEHGSSKPGTDALEGIARAGINTNWLLTGDGPIHLSELLSGEDSMLLADLKPVGLDMPRFLLAIEAVEEGLAASNRTMLPDKKAELFLAVYDMMEEPTITKDRVLKLVKLAA